MTEERKYINTGIDPELSRPEEQPAPFTTDRMYRIACTLPALRLKGVENGKIPGIDPNFFSDHKLSEYLYKGRGGLLSSGEFLLFEFLLNLYDPYTYQRFNFGRAVNVLDDGNLFAMINALWLG